MTTTTLTTTSSASSSVHHHHHHHYKQPPTRRRVVSHLAVVQLTVALVLVANLFVAVDCFDYRDVLPKNKYHHWYQSNSEYFATLVNTPFSPAASHANTYLYQMYGVSSGAVIDVEVKQACRLNLKPCQTNSDCCSRFCICNRWNSLGFELCWRRCL